jgi:ankyrin repeat protein
MPEAQESHWTWPTPALSLAIEHHRTDVVRALVEAKANVNIRYDVMCDDGEDDCKNNVAEVRTPLFDAYYAKETEVFDLLIKAGADLNHSDRYDLTVLHGACMGGEFEFAQILVQNKCEPESRSNNGTTPFMAACEGGNQQISELPQV